MSNILKIGSMQGTEYNEKFQNFDNVNHAYMSWMYKNMFKKNASLGAIFSRVWKYDLGHFKVKKMHTHTQTLSHILICE